MRRVARPAGGTIVVQGNYAWTRYRTAFESRKAIERGKAARRRLQTPPHLPEILWLTEPDRLKAMLKTDSSRTANHTGISCGPAEFIAPSPRSDRGIAASFRSSDHSD
jgi:hypothetical protein